MLSTWARFTLMGSKSGLAKQQVKAAALAACAWGMLNEDSR